MSDPNDWLIDLGHSRVKWGQASAGELLPDTTAACSYVELARLEQALAASAPGRVWLSGQSNRESVTAVTSLTHRLGLSLHPVRTGTPPLPVKPAYATLGSDRWLALQWPWQQARKALCVVDCGTALTIDLVDDDGCHRGGWILAGLDTLRRALLDRARGLPDVAEVAASPEQPATDTLTAVASGTLLQVTGPIQSALASAVQLFGHAPAVWLTGGDAPTLLAHLDGQVEHDPHLVLRGLALASRVNA